LCRVPATPKATGAAKSPESPVHAGWLFEAALPKAKPTQTITDHDFLNQINSDLLNSRNIAKTGRQYQQYSLNDKSQNDREPRDPQESRA